MSEEKVFLLFFSTSFKRALFKEFAANERKRRQGESASRPNPKKGVRSAALVFDNEKEPRPEKKCIRKGKIDFVYKKSAEIDSVSREEKPTDSEKNGIGRSFYRLQGLYHVFCRCQACTANFFSFSEKFFQGEKGGRFGPPRPPILRASIVRKKRTLFKEKSTKYANKRSISPCYFCRNMIQ